MVNYCILCEGISYESVPMFYYSFPNDPPIRKLWADFCGIKEFEILGNYRLCSKHFCEEDFIEDNVQGVKILKRGTIPTIRRGEKRKLLDKFIENEIFSKKNSFSSYQNNETNNKSCQTSERPFSQMVPRYLGDVNIENLPLSSDEKQYLNVVKMGISQQKRKIKSCQQNNRRLENRLTVLKDTIIKLRKSMTNINDNPEPSSD